MTRGRRELHSAFKARAPAACILILSCLILAGLALPAHADGGYSSGPHRENGGPFMDSGGSDAEAPIWEAPPLVLAEYALATAFLALGMGCLIPVLGRIQDVLSHDKRKAIYDYVCQNPGSTITGISAGLSINIGTVYHHLWMLQARRKVFFESRGKFVRVYEGRLASSEKTMDRAIYAHANNEISRRLLKVMLEDPGLNSVALAHVVGLDKSTISWHMQRLRKDGLVHMVREGRQKRCFINDQARAILKLSVDN